MYVLRRPNTANLCVSTHSRIKLMCAFVGCVWILGSAWLLFRFQLRGWPLEELRMVVNLESTAPPTLSDATIDLSDCSYIITGLTMEGAAWDGDRAQLALSSVVRTPLGAATFTWVPSDAAVAHASDAACHMVKLPVYLNTSRKQLIFHIFLRAPRDVPLPVWEQRAVCLLAWSQHHR